MKKVSLTSTIVAILFLVASVALAQSLPPGDTVTDDGTDRPVHAVFGGSDNLDRGTIELPEPISPAPVQTIRSKPFELVGVTEFPFRGNRGVLNYTLACQKLYPGSRMCTAAEISNTINIPSATGHFYAWVGTGSIIPSPEVSNCGSWMSDSSSTFGLTIHIGPESDCYGSIVVQACDTPLPVACCAQAPES